MNKIKNLIKALLLVMPIIFGLGSCDKLPRPALPKDYPQDLAVTPTTSLRFYLPFDSTSEADKQINVRFADSISSYPSFFPDPSTMAVPGVTGTAYQGSLGTFLHYYSANDFGSSTSFTIAFWLQVTLAQKDHNNADGIMALSSTTNFWSDFAVYADHESSTSDSMQLKFVFANGSGNNWDFAGYTGNARWPHMYDGNWHHVAFTYDAGTKTGTMYRDGVQFDQKIGETIAFDGMASQFVVGGFQEAVNIVDTYANNSWMSGFPGAIDQVRLYNAALSASDVAALYNNKQ
jgi:hypothetical protein